VVEDTWEWQRLGESMEFGECLLELLEKQGWTISRRPGFAGVGVLLVATRRDVAYAVSGDGSTTASAALTLFNEIASQPSLMRAAA
jgi:hypothetical protein